MGIRYVAYAFEPHQTELALARPVSVLCGYCSREAGGAQGRQRDGVDFLDLDKAWGDLQRATAPADGEVARHAFRMFEGEVTWTDEGHLPYVRAISPEELPPIAKDLSALDDAVVGRTAERFLGRGSSAAEYALQHLQHARAFTCALADQGRGMVYKIG